MAEGKLYPEYFMHMCIEEYCMSLKDARTVVRVREGSLLDRHLGQNFVLYQELYQESNLLRYRIYQMLVYSLTLQHKEKENCTTTVEPSGPLEQLRDFWHCKYRIYNLASHKDYEMHLMHRSTLEHWLDKDCIKIRHSVGPVWPRYLYIGLPVRGEAKMMEVPADDKQVVERVTQGRTLSERRATFFDAKVREIYMRPTNPSLSQIGPPCGSDREMWCLCVQPPPAAFVRYYYLLPVYTYIWDMNTQITVFTNIMPQSALLAMLTHWQKGLEEHEHSGCSVHKVSITAAVKQCKFECRINLYTLMYCIGLMIPNYLALYQGNKWVIRTGRWKKAFNGSQHVALQDIYCMIRHQLYNTGTSVPKHKIRANHGVPCANAKRVIRTRVPVQQMMCAGRKDRHVDKFAHMIKTKYEAYCTLHAVARYRQYGRFMPRLHTSLYNSIVQ